MNNLKLGIRLIGAFFLISVIILVVGLISRDMAIRMNDSFVDIVIDALPSVRALLVISEAQTTIQAVENALLSKSLNLKKHTDNIARDEAAHKRINEALKKYEPLDRTKEEDMEWKEFMIAWRAWLKDHKDFMEIANTYKKSPSDTLYGKICAQAWDINAPSFFHAENHLNNLIEINSNEATIGFNESNRIMSNSLLIISVAIVFGVILSILLGLFTTRSITTPLIKVRDAAAHIGKGALDTAIDSKSKDEIGDLARSIKKMAADLSVSMQKEKQHAAAEAAEAAEKQNARQLHALNQQLQASEQQLKASNQQLRAKEQTLLASHKELSVKMNEVASFNKLMVGRELEMIKLKKEVNSLLEIANQPFKYEMV